MRYLYIFILFLLSGCSVTSSYNEKAMKARAKECQYLCQNHVKKFEANPWSPDAYTCECKD